MKMVVKTPKTKIITIIIKLPHYSMKKKYKKHKINFQVPYGLYKSCHLSKTHGDFTFPHSYKHHLSKSPPCCNSSIYMYTKHPQMAAHMLRVTLQRLTKTKKRILANLAQCGTLTHLIEDPLSIHCKIWWFSIPHYNLLMSFLL